MTANRRTTTAERTIGLVPCPVCGGAGEGCTLCRGGKYVTVDAAIRWKVRRDSKPPDPPPVVEQKPSEADSLLLSAIDTVLEKLAMVDGRSGAHALSERATTLRGTVLDWQACAPSASERHDITGKVLGLHVALSRLLRRPAKSSDG